ncbi:hypothetical protein EST38_g9793 [Candolleomyces aberdarensis]|uniref:Uncharacterized protein n=1 Tax=Candolleomyces aberdarensis TaxID=2316362 RepID=A0A4Q2DAR4_9AGAR|nr:hypothetical protein EST38_g9793 [Candolleomyces aberdarensis]
MSDTTDSPAVTVFPPSLGPAESNPRRLHTLGGIIPRRELRVDFTKGDWTDPVGERDLCSMVREAIAQYEDIDAVCLKECSAPENEPNPNIWMVFDGVQPTHLEMTAGWDEECNHSGLEVVSPPWPLKSMYYSSFFGPGSWEAPEGPVPTFPACYADLETLVLHYVDSRSLYYYPRGGATSLRSLTVAGNDAIGSFAHTVDCNPKMLSTLRSVTIYPTTCWLSDVQIENFPIMKMFLSRSEALSHLELAILDNGFDLLPDDEDEGETPNLSDYLPYLGLYDHFPSSLISLSFRGPLNIYMFNDLENWIAKADDPLWLPDLRSFAFDMVSYRYNRKEDEAEVERAQIDGKIAELLDAMKRHRPALEIEEPRPLDELVYPHSIS